MNTMGLDLIGVGAQIGLFLATLLLAYVGYYQINKVRAQSNADFIARLNREFFYENEVNRSIVRTVKEGGPILKKNGGAFTEYDIEGCIRYFEMIERFIAEGVISFGLVDEMFGSHIVRCWENGEIKGYILGESSTQKDNRYFEHFEMLAIRIAGYRKRQP